MNKVLVILLVISIIVNFFSLFVLYKYYQARKSINYMRSNMGKYKDAIEDLTGILDEKYPHKMVFLHHSVGRGILYEGGLRDSLLKSDILVKGATYGDNIGQNTDILDWPSKFKNEMDQILRFKAHPNIYYSDSQNNEIVMFKSCFNNSNIELNKKGTNRDNKTKKSIANYKDAFNSIKDEIRKYPQKLFIYVTSPPLVEEATSNENAARARGFNDWVINEFLTQYRKETGLNNLVIFDLFGILADRNNFLREEYRTNRSGDSHPNAIANKEAAEEFMEFFRPIWENWKGRKTD